MLVYFMQHGPCLSEELDPARPLSPVGRDLIERSARGVRGLGLRFDLMASSPKARALQTARLVAAALYGPDKAEGMVRVDDAFLPLSSPGMGVEFLRRHADAPRVFVAGHLPNLARVASLLLTPGPEVNLAFDHGGLVCVETDLGPAPGRLRLLLSASVLHAAAG